MGIKRRTIDPGKKKQLPTLRKMPENVPSLPHPHPKHPKSATMTQKTSFFLKPPIWASKNAEFYADPKLADADLNKCP
jgi:hypothetical protein